VFAHRRHLDQGAMMGKELSILSPDTVDQPPPAPLF
jgi:hypothetical protein